MNPPKIAPFLWFDDNAEEAVDFYISVFPESRKLGVLPGPGGKPLTISFELGGNPFTALNGGPGDSFNNSVSFFVSCEDQAEIDYYWSALTADGGAEIQCGWLKDKFGMRWQIVPTNIMDLVKSKAGMEVMLKMKKLVIAGLEAATKQ